MLQVGMVETAAIQLLWVLPQSVVVVERGLLTQAVLLIQVIQAVLEAALRSGTIMEHSLVVPEQVDKGMQVVL